MYTGYQTDAPFVIRYPRGKGEKKDWRNEMTLLPVGKGRKLREGKDIAVLSIGAIGNEVIKAIEMVESEGISVAHYDMIYLKPIDEVILDEVGQRFKRVITVENGVVKGGLGSAVAEYMSDHDYQTHVWRIGVPDQFWEARWPSICRIMITRHMSGGLACLISLWSMVPFRSCIACVEWTRRV